MRTILLDGDIFAYKAACANTKDYGFGVDVDEAGARDYIDRKIDEVANVLEPNNIIVCLSDPEANFRKGILPTYKSKRGPKPELVPVMKEYLGSKYETFIRPALEADDVLGILSTAQKIAGEKIIVSADKDLKGIPGLLFNDNHSHLGVVEISTFDADYWHMMQTLMGDTTDGYTGCPGIGPVKATAILNVRETMPAEGDLHEYQCKRWWRAVVETFGKATLTYEDALVQARVARILRACDYDFINRRPILWTPN